MKKTAKLVMAAGVIAVLAPNVWSLQAQAAKTSWEIQENPTKVDEIERHGIAYSVYPGRCFLGKKDGKIVLLDENLKVVKKTDYTVAGYETYESDSNIWMAKESNGKSTYALMDPKGNEISKFSIENGLAYLGYPNMHLLLDSEDIYIAGKVVKGVVKYGAVNRKGETVIPFEYTYANTNGTFTKVTNGIEKKYWYYKGALVSEVSSSSEYEIRNNVFEYTEKNARNLLSEAYEKLSGNKAYYISSDWTNVRGDGKNGEFSIIYKVGTKEADAVDYMVCLNYDYNASAKTCDIKILTCGKLLDENYSCVQEKSGNVVLVGNGVKKVMDAEEYAKAKNMAFVISGIVTYNDVNGNFVIYDYNNKTTKVFSKNFVFGSNAGWIGKDTDGKWCSVQIAANENGSLKMASFKKQDDDLFGRLSTMKKVQYYATKNGKHYVFATEGQKKVLYKLTDNGFVKSCEVAVVNNADVEYELVEVKNDVYIIKDNHGKCEVYNEKGERQNVNGKNTFTAVDYHEDGIEVYSNDRPKADYYVCDSQNGKLVVTDTGFEDDPDYEYIYVSKKDKSVIRITWDSKYLYIKDMNGNVLLKHKKKQDSTGCVVSETSNQIWVFDHEWNGMEGKMPQKYPDEELNDAKLVNRYKIINRGKLKNGKVTGGTVAFIETHKNSGTITIPSTVTVDGVKYKVTTIEKNALKNKKKITKIVIGKNVTKIGSNAFVNCKKVKMIDVQTKSLKSVGKNALKGVNKKAVISVPKKSAKKYKKLFKKSTGYKKTMTLKKQ